MFKDIRQNPLHLHHFDSLATFVDFVATVPAGGEFSRECREKYGSRCPGKVSDAASRDGNWAGTETFEEAVRLAREGWPEGLKKLRFDFDIAKTRLTASAVPVRYMDVAGAYPMVPHAVAGDPFNMVNLRHTVSMSKPIVRLLIDQGGTWAVKSKQKTLRGAAILAHVDRLESEGFSVEVSMFWTVVNAGHGFITSLTVKRAGEPLELDRLAFFFINPAVQRRFTFAIMESHEESMKRWNTHYGFPLYVHHSQIDSDLTLIPMADRSDKHWDNIDSANKRIKELLEGVDHAEA